MINSETGISSCIDWISVTCEKVEYPPEWSKLKKELDYSMNRYDTVVQYIDGRIEMCSSVRNDMKVHVLCAGTTITKMCNDYEITSFDIFSLLLGAYSRLDIAVDVKRGSLDIPALRAQFVAGKADTRAREGLYLEGLGTNGETVYIGSRNSPKRLRIYDKSAETGTDYEWTRVELQYRHNEAKRISIVLLESDDIASEVPKCINQFCSFPEDKLWAVTLGTEKAIIGKPLIQKSQREKWLLGTAAKSLGKEMFAGGKGERLLDQFVAIAQATAASENLDYTS